MTRQRLRSADGTRGAEVYLCAGTLSTYRIRAEKYPEHSDHMAEGGYWFGGRVLWGHDQTSMATAVAVANRWVTDGMLPATTDLTTADEGNRYVEGVRAHWRITIERRPVDEQPSLLP